MRDADNVLCYESLGWILNYSDDGFFLLIASPPMQKEILARYKGSNIMICDCRKEKRNYYFSDVFRMIEENPGKSAYFLQNFQCVLSVRYFLGNLKTALCPYLHS